MNILLINHYAGSPKLGMEFRPYYLSRKWIEQGHNVTVIVADHSHIRKENPKFDSDFFEEEIDGINYLWIKTRSYKENSPARVMNIFQFTLKLIFKAKYLAKKIKPDIVIASSTYTSDNYPAQKIAKHSKAKYIYEVHDLWPLSPIELGGMSKYHPFIIIMQMAEDFAYKKADAVISMLPKTKEYMTGRGLLAHKWYYIPNGFVLDEWTNKAELDSEVSDSIDKIKSQYKNLIAYTGTIGLANALDSFIITARKFDDQTTAFVIVGKGPEKEKLIKLVEDENIQNVFFIKNVEKQQIPSLLNKFDYLYIGLKFQALFRFGISPNKMIDYMMAGKPIIQAIDAGNNIVEEAACGIYVEPENPDALYSAIKKLNEYSEIDLLNMGENGKAYALKNHDYEKLAEKFINIFESLID